MKISKNELLSICERYLDSLKNNSKTDYTNVRSNFSKLFLYRFFDNLKNSLISIDSGIENDIVNELNYNINKIHGGTFYDNIQDKINGETRKSSIPPIYSLINYEFIIEKVFFLIKHIMINNNKFNFLIDDKYFAYANQYEINNKNNTIKKHYIDLWNKFKDSHKDIHKKSLRFVLKTDLKDFYDSINHNSILEELKIFVNNNISFNNLKEELDFLENNFGFIWDKNSDFEKTFDKFLYEVSNILLKVNKYHNSGIPQNIIASDFLASLYIFIKFYNNLTELKLEMYKDEKGNQFYYNKEKNNEIYFNNYSDDFVIFTNDYIYGKKFLNDSLINFFAKDGIKFNAGKTKIENYVDFIKNDYIELDFDKIFKKDKEELIKYKEMLLKGLQEKNKNKCKTLIKFFYITTINDKLNIEILEELENLIEIGNLKSFGKNNEKNNENIEFFLNLIRLHPKLAIQVYKLMDKYSNKNRYLIKYYKFIDHFFPLLTSNTLGIILLKLNYDTEHFFDSNFRKKIYEAIINKNESNFYINKLLNREKYYSIESTIFKDYKGLSNFLFNSEYKKGDIRENNIGIMLKSLFGVNDLISEKLNNKYKGLKKDEPEYVNELLSSLSFILEEMLKEKEKNNLFYLISPNFIADLHSLFNNLLSIIISLKEKKSYTCDMGRNKNILNIKINNNNSNSKLFLKKDLGFLEDEVNLLHYIKKKRAFYVHKERESNENELILKCYNKFNNMSLLQTSISNILLSMFNLIDKKL